MGASVFEQVLGDRIEGLSPRIRPYCAAIPAGRQGVGRGVYRTAGLRVRALAPVFAWLAWRRIVFPEFGRDVPFTVVNRDDAGARRAQRTFDLPGVTRVMTDRMAVVDGRLHDRLGRRGGLEVRLAVEVVDGGLRMTSTRLWLRLGPLRLPLPPVAAVTLDERTDPDDAALQRIILRLTVPLLGDVFGYDGRFAYGVVARPPLVE